MAGSLGIEREAKTLSTASVRREKQLAVSLLAASCFREVNFKL